MTIRLLCVAVLIVCAACSDDTAPTAVQSSSPVASSDPPSPTTATASSASLDPARRSAGLQAALDSFVARQRVPFSVVAIDLATGARVSHLADRQVLSASLYKLFVARELLRRIRAGTLDRDQAAGTGDGRTVGECVHDMIVVSDNACGTAGLAMVSGGRLDAALHADGFVGTSLASPQHTTADDVADFLVRARDHDPELYQLLRDQRVNDRFTLGLPEGTPLAHKTGDRREWAHDAGVITAPHGDVVLVGLSGPWPGDCCDADKPGPGEAVAFGALGDLAAAVYAAS